MGDFMAVRPQGGREHRRQSATRHCPRPAAIGRMC